MVKTDCCCSWSCSLISLFLSKIGLLATAREGKAASVFPRRKTVGHPVERGQILTLLPALGSKIKTGLLWESGRLIALGNGLLYFAGNQRADAYVYAAIRLDTCDKGRAFFSLWILFCPVSQLRLGSSRSCGLGFRPDQLQTLCRQVRRGWSGSWPQH